jgi:hypothetical protein
MVRVKRLAVKYRRQLAVLSFEKDRRRVVAPPEQLNLPSIVRCPDGCC